MNAAHCDIKHKNDLINEYSGLFELLVSRTYTTVPDKYMVPSNPIPYSNSDTATNIRDRSNVKFPRLDHEPYKRKDDGSPVDQNSPIHIS